MDLTVVQDNIVRIGTAGLFRSKTVNAAFWGRSEMIASQAGDSAAYNIVAGLLFESGVC